MGQIPRFLSWRNMLVLSLAVNCSLILKILKGDRERGDSWDITAYASTWPVVSTTASGSSLLSSASCNYSKIEEDDDRIINLKL